MNQNNTKVIMKYVEDFFEVNKTNEAYTLIQELEEKFDLSTQQAYHYVAICLNKKWKTQEWRIN